MRARRFQSRLATAALVVAAALLAPAAASAATTHLPGLAVGGIFDKIGEFIFNQAGLGIKEFGKLILNLLGGIADLLVPDEWAHRGAAFIQWLAAVPDYTAPAFKGLHSLRRMNVWIALTLLPVTLAWAGVRALSGASESETIAAVVVRTLGVGAALVLWAPLWQQAAALTNQLTNAYLSAPIVVAGINDYMNAVAVGGLLGGIPFLGVLIMLLAGFLFLAVLALKVGILLVGGLLYAFGPLLLAVAPDRAGATMLRRYGGLLWTIFALPVRISAIYAVSAIFIHSAAPIGDLLGGKGSVFRDMTGTVIVGFAAILGPLMCIGLARRAFAPALQTLGSVAGKARPSALAERGAAALKAARTGALGGGSPVRPRAAAASPGAGVGALAKAAEVRQHREAGRLLRSGIRTEMGQATPRRKALMMAQLAGGGGIVGASTLGAGMVGDATNARVSSAMAARSERSSGAPTNTPQAPTVAPVPAGRGAGVDPGSDHGRPGAAEAKHGDPKPISGGHGSPSAADVQQWRDRNGVAGLEEEQRPGHALRKAQRQGYVAGSLGVSDEGEMVVPRPGHKGPVTIAERANGGRVPIGAASPINGRTDRPRPTDHRSEPRTSTRPDVAPVAPDSETRIIRPEGDSQ